MKKLKAFFSYIGEKTGINKAIFATIVSCSIISFSIGYTMSPDIEDNPTFISMQEQLTSTQQEIKEWKEANKDQRLVIQRQKEQLEKSAAYLDDIIKKHASDEFRLEQFKQENAKLALEVKYLKQENELLNQRLNDTSFIWE